MKHITLRGNQLFYEDLHPDREEIILLVHGHPFDHSMWDYQVDALKDFRLILPDLRGYGKSDYRFEKIFIEEQAFDLALLLDALQIDQVHLVGLSMGGQIIVEFSRLFPHRVRSLVLCDSSPAGENEASYQARLQLANHMLDTGMSTYTEQHIHEYLHPKTIEARGEVYHHLFEMMVNTQVEGAVASHRGRAERRNNYGYLKEIPVPVLVMVGDRDFFTPVPEMKDIAEQIPEAKFAVVENAGHMPNMEQAEVFNRLLLEFYQKN